MRPIEEIKEDIAYETGLRDDTTAVKQFKLDMLDIELRAAYTDGIPLDQLETYCNAIRDGRCVVLPCKVGDTVYMANRERDGYIKDNVSKHKIDYIEVIGWSNEKSGITLISKKKKTKIYASYESAESALAAQEGKQP